MRWMASRRRATRCARRGGGWCAGVVRKVHYKNNVPKHACFSRVLLEKLALALQGHNSKTEIITRWGLRETRA